MRGPIIICEQSTSLPSCCFSPQYYNRIWWAYNLVLLRLLLPVGHRLLLFYYVHFILPYCYCHYLRYYFFIKRRSGVNSDGDDRWQLRLYTRNATQIDKLGHKFNVNNLHTRRPPPPLDHHLVNVKRFTPGLFWHKNNIFNGRRWLVNALVCVSKRICVFQTRVNYVYNLSSVSLFEQRAVVIQRTNILKFWKINIYSFREIIYYNVIVRNKISVSCNRYWN